MFFTQNNHTQQQETFNQYLYLQVQIFTRGYINLHYCIRCISLCILFTFSSWPFNIKIRLIFLDMMGLTLLWFNNVGSNVVKNGMCCSFLVDAVMRKSAAQHMFICFIINHFSRWVKRLVNKGGCFSWQEDERWLSARSHPTPLIWGGWKDQNEYPRVNPSCLCASLQCSRCFPSDMHKRSLFLLPGLFIPKRSQVTLVSGWSCHCESKHLMAIGVWQQHHPCKKAPWAPCDGLNWKASTFHMLI